jgi:predicted DsbA family dithiol-disulfide isomerase
VSTDIVPRVLVFFDYACQFCYLDWPRLKQLRAEHDAELVVVPYELRPQLPAAGVSISEVGGAHSERVEEHMRKMAEEGGLTLLLAQFVPNTHLALALGEYARDTGPEVHERVHEAIFSAYNGYGEDIGDVQQLLRIADEQGLDSADVTTALSEGRYDERLHQFHHLALGFGITATPSALICNELLIGSRPYRVLEESLERCMVTADTIAEETDAGTQGAPSAP